MKPVSTHLTHSASTSAPNTLPASGPLPPSALDTAITRALSQPPVISIPSDFATRVARSAAAQPQPRVIPWLGWGPRLALGSGVVLTLALFALAPHTAPSLISARFDAELGVLAELGALLLFAPRLLRRD